MCSGVATPGPTGALAPPSISRAQCRELQIHILYTVWHENLTVIKFYGLSELLKKLTDFKFYGYRSNLVSLQYNSKS